jgi:anti-anti-sigma factor
VELMLQVKFNEDKPVLTCHGHLICGQEAEALQAALGRLLIVARGVTLDLGDIRKIDCAGLGVIAEALRVARLSGKSLELRSVPPNVRQLMEVTGLSAVLCKQSDQTYVGASAA